MDDLLNILTIKSLEIGFSSGSRNILLPPLSGSAVKGELIAIIGRNGIGKSTLLRTLAAIQQPLGGEIYYFNKEIREYSGIDLARTAGYISTESVKVSNMTVYDLVSLGRFPYTGWLGNISQADHEIITDDMEKAYVSSFSGRFLAEMSDGERQKAMIARLLAQDTGIMLMDEPTAFLDIRSKFDILHLLHQLCHKSGRTIIFTTHDLEMAIRHSDKIWLILGSGLMEGAPEDLMITGQFDHLFESSSIIFNSRDGTYQFREEAKGSIFIKGSGKLRHWTEKAVRRAGYLISDSATIPYIDLEDDKWVIVADGEKKECNSVYELVRRLSEEDLI
jgi:iron complex transport system ATP-binding protein